MRTAEIAGLILFASSISKMSVVLNRGRVAQYDTETVDISLMTKQYFLRSQQLSTCVNIVYREELYRICPLSWTY